MTGESPGRSRARALGRAFDQAFAEPPRGAAEPVDNLLGITVAGDPYALRLDELTELFTDRKIVPVPGPRRALAGLAGLRGGMVPVYRLAELLGYPPDAATLRWLVLVGATQPVGLAFERFDSYLRVPRSAILPAQGEARRAHVRDTARTADGLRPLISVASIVDSLKEPGGADGTIKER